MAINTVGLNRELTIALTSCFQFKVRTSGSEYTVVFIAELYYTSIITILFILQVISN